MSSLRFNASGGEATRRGFVALAVAAFTLGTYGMARAAGNVNGAAGQMPAFYENQLFTINIFQLSDTAAASTIANNKSLNQIFVSNDLDEVQEFIPVIDAVPGDSFTPLWKQFLIVFNAGFAPRQFTSEDDIEAAVAASEIKLVDTGEVYRCSVVRSGLSVR